MTHRVQRPLRVLLVGEEAAAVQTFRMIRETDNDLVGVMTGRSGALSSLAEQCGVRVWPAATVREPAFADDMRAAGVDLLLNVHSLYIVPPSVLEAPAIGSFNVHPGPLPEYAGLNAPSWAILNGESTHAATVHWMDAGIDTGDVAYEDRFDIAPNETGFTLSAKAVTAAIPLLRRLLETAAAEPRAIPRKKQRAVTGTYHGREVPNEGRIRWTVPAMEVERFVRAADYAMFDSPWGAPRTTLPGVGEVEITKTGCTGDRAEPAPGTITGDASGDVRVACADEWLNIEKIRIDGKPGAPARLLEARAFEA